MSTATTYTPAAGVPSGAGTGGGWLSRVMERMAAAQMSVARKRVNEHLRTMGEGTLTRIGFTPEQIATLRAGGQVDFPA